MTLEAVLWAITALMWLVMLIIVLWALVGALLDGKDDA